MGCTSRWESDQHTFSHTNLSSSNWAPHFDSLSLYFPYSHIHLCTCKAGKAFGLQTWVVIFTSLHFFFFPKKPQKHLNPPGCSLPSFLSRSQDHSLTQMLADRAHLGSAFKKLACKWDHKSCSWMNDGLLRQSPPQTDDLHGWMDGQIQQGLEKADGASNICTAREEWSAQANIHIRLNSAYTLRLSELGVTWRRVQGGEAQCIPSMLSISSCEHAG